MTRAAALLAALLLGAAAPLPAQLASTDLDRVRSLYLEAVRSEPAIEAGLQALAELRRAQSPAADSELGATLRAYRGALVTLRAKHALWPPTRLRHLREGLAELDAVVAAHPDLAEARYLRLMSCYYLPAILGRSDSVREDFRALAELLPRARGAYPEEAYAAIARFVLEHGRLAPEQRRALAHALASADG